MSESTLLNPDYLKHKVLKGLSLSIGIMIAIFIVINISAGAYFLAGIEVFLVLSCVFVYRQIKHDRLSSLQSLIVPYCIVMIVIFGTYQRPFAEGIFLWTFIVPTLFYLLYGRKHGFVASLLIVLIQVIILDNKSDIELYSSFIVNTNFALAYITVWVISHVYESNRENTQTKLQALALTDSLTSANNRLAFKHQFNREMKSSSALSIALIDLDYFKRVNDRYGHEAGDTVLKVFIEVVCRILDKSQVFRLGGEEFALLIPEAKESAYDIAEQVRIAVENELIQYKSDQLQITCSIGVSQCDPSKELSESLSEADKALYEAKSRDRNNTVIFPWSE